MRYFLFLDESGDASLNKVDPRWDTFVLCGILFSEPNYKQFNQALINLKLKIFKDPKVVFHSYDIRRLKGPFKILRDDDLKAQFYEEMSKIFNDFEYTVFASIIDKPRYRKKYPKRDQAYEESLMFIAERAINMINKSHDKLIFCLEKRNNSKNRILKKYYQKFLNYGTVYCSNLDFECCEPVLEFRDKNQQVNGIELADICAYPIAWNQLNPGKNHPTLDQFQSKIYRRFDGLLSGYGLKLFP